MAQSKQSSPTLSALQRDYLLRSVKAIQRPYIVWIWYDMHQCCKRYEFSNFNTAIEFARQIDINDSAWIRKRMRYGANPVETLAFINCSTYIRNEILNHIEKNKLYC